MSPRLNPKSNMSSIALILGCGRSLNELPCELLDKYPSFGGNYIGLSGIQPTYYVCVDYRVLQDYEGIRDTACNAKIAYLGQVLPITSPIYSSPNVVLLSRDKRDFKEEQSFAGGTVTYPMLKLAYYEGFEEVHLWGMDFDPNWQHFTNDYPVLGHSDRKIDAMLYHFQLADRVYRKAGKRIINFSYPSMLDTIFKRRIDNETNISRTS